MFEKKIGIDLGTANTVVFAPGKGFIINEPTIVALTKPDNTVLAVGLEAKEMIGRTPDEIVAYRPLKDGVIADYYITKAMLAYFISKAVGWLNVMKPDVVISVPAGITQTERRARSWCRECFHRSRTDPRRAWRRHSDQCALRQYDRQYRWRNIRAGSHR